MSVVRGGSKLAVIDKREMQMKYIGLDCHKKSVLKEGRAYIPGYSGHKSPSWNTIAVPQDWFNLERTSGLQD